MSSNDGKTSRREFLTSSIELTPIAALVPTVAQPPEADDAQRSAPAPDHPTEADYRPAFFTPEEWVFINAACARLIPADAQRPSAVELGVPQYIDQLMGTPWADWAIWYMQGPFFEAAPEFGYQSQLTPKQQYRLGIKAIDGMCRQHLNNTFAALTASQQDDVRTGAESLPEFSRCGETIYSPLSAGDVVNLDDPTAVGGVSELQAEHFGVFAGLLHTGFGGHAQFLGFNHRNGKVTAVIQ